MGNSDEYQKQTLRVEAIASGLRDVGLFAATQDTGGGTLCVVVDCADNGQIVWGTSDVNWGGSIEDSGGEFVSGIDTDCPSETDDVAAIVDALRQASLSHGAILS